MTFTAEGEKDMDDKLIIGGREFTSRFILGSGKFSLNMTKIVIENAGVEMATLAIRRANAGGEENILDYMPVNNVASKHVRCEKCQRSCQDSTSCQRAWMRRFRQGRSDT